MFREHNRNDKLKTSNNNDVVENVNTMTNDDATDVNDTNSWFMQLFDKFGCWIYVACATIIGLLCFVLLYFKRKWGSK